MPSTAQASARRGASPLRAGRGSSATARADARYALPSLEGSARLGGSGSLVTLRLGAGGPRPGWDAGPRALELAVLLGADSSRHGLGAALLAGCAAPVAVPVAQELH